MPIEFSRDIFILIATSLAGGLLARSLKLQPIIGYLLAGIVARGLFPSGFFGLENLAQLGLIFLLFSVGLELSLTKLTRVIRISTLGAGLQIILVTVFSWLILRALAVDFLPALILSLGFSLSSTALVVKVLADRGEEATLPAEIMVGWLIIQDLAVIPLLIILKSLKTGLGWGTVFDLLRAGLVIVLMLVLSRIIIPQIMRRVAAFNWRELMILTSAFLALSVALVAYYLGISPAIGAFIAGLVLAETQEKHSVFAEIRPLRDLFAAIFFVSLGFLVLPSALWANLGLILALVLLVVVIKLLTVLAICLLLGYHGRTAIFVGLGLSQIGEFSFILFSLANNLGLLSERWLTLGIVTTLFSLVVFPLLYNQAPFFWSALKKIVQRFPGSSRYLLGWDKSSLADTQEPAAEIIICGYGRVGKWVGKAMTSLKIPFRVIDYNQTVVKLLRAKGLAVIYGDPTEKEILEAAGVQQAKLIVVAIPDRTTQEAIVAQAKNLNPAIKIISRVHSDEEGERLKLLKVEKIVQPEFEAALAITRACLFYLGKSREEIAGKIKGLRQAHSLLAQL